MTAQIIQFQPRHVPEVEQEVRPEPVTPHKVHWVSDKVASLHCSDGQCERAVPRGAQVENVILTTLAIAYAALVWGTHLKLIWQFISRIY